MNKIDGSYRLLFSNPHLVRDLIRGFVDEPSLASMDWSKLVPLLSDYVSDSLRQRQGDGVWYLPRQDGKSIYFLLMLEHQSTNDRIMALRLATYSALLYETLMASKLVSRKAHLPRILPVVLYSGIKRWTAPRSMNDLLESSPRALRPYALQLRYLLIDESELVRRDALPANNFASLLFRLEHNQGIDDVQNLVHTVWDRTTGPEFTELRIAFTTWIKYVLLPRALPDVALPAVDDLLEIKAMMTEHSRAWTHQWKAEGLKEGLEEGLKQGLEKGHQEGASAILEKQLQRKFGSLPGTIQQRIKNATTEQLETWSLNVLALN